MNVVILNGRITRDIEIREIPNGAHVTEFSIAVRRETKEDVADFINIQAWRQQADYLGDHAHKGTMISVVGKYREDKYIDRDGVERRKVYIMADRVEILSQPKDAQEKVNREKSVEESNRDFVNSVANTPYADNFGSNLSDYVEESDLPFY